MKKSTRDSTTFYDILLNIISGLGDPTLVVDQFVLSYTAGDHDLIPFKTGSRRLRLEIQHEATYWPSTALLLLTWPYMPRPQDDWLSLDFLQPHTLASTWKLPSETFSMIFNTQKLAISSP